MFGDEELLLIGVSTGLWLGALSALVAGHPRMARWIALLAALLSIATLVVLRPGTGHRA